MFNELGGKLKDQTINRLMNILIASFDGRVWDVVVVRAKLELSRAVRKLESPCIHAASR